VVKKGGIIVSIADDPDQTTLDAHGIHGASIRSSPKANVLEELTRLIDKKKITPVISQVLPLSEVAKAHEQIATRHTRGKIVLKIKLERNLRSNWFP
jgi:NADPH:quinone reductase-like Zn-dependent oxidoreductase